ncbi:hypothetical protein BLNAU_7540 [Blattamonas nauphoetae]|uniref:Uncharacterized protein n=1 Tax=Blattamonas nauphoetae TaxID=2049346 RepID=A0ABQ9Y143_9EUKA|nr:hypothetical protein BLNAU_7540 [Blattamonas nauphoetae]
MDGRRFPDEEHHSLCFASGFVRDDLIRLNEQELHGILPAFLQKVRNSFPDRDQIGFSNAIILAPTDDHFEVDGTCVEALVEQASHKRNEEPSPFETPFPL